LKDVHCTAVIQNSFVGTTCIITVHYRLIDKSVSRFFLGGHLDHTVTLLSYQTSGKEC